MRVFVAWSGSLSGALAEALRDWLPRILQSIEPFVSLKDIEAGARWQSEIGKQLDSTDFGLLCLTPDNLANPWIHFEAGALAKRMESARVVPLYFDVDATEVKPPLSQFQGKELDQGGIRSLVVMLNSNLPKPLTDTALNESFELWWPKLSDKITDARTSHSSGKTVRPKHREQSDIANETLELARTTAREVAGLKDQFASLRLESESARLAGRFVVSPSGSEIGRGLLGLGSVESTLLGMRSPPPGLLGLIGHPPTVAITAVNNPGGVHEALAATASKLAEKTPE